MAGRSRPAVEVDLRAFGPIPFREIGPGVEFNANVCRNPMCPDFGPAPARWRAHRPARGAHAGRYRVDPDERRPMERSGATRSTGNIPVNEAPAP